MRVQREKAYEAAQKLIAKGRLDKAITEYQRVVQANPSDDRTMLKIAELQTRMRAYDAAVATYERVGAYYASQGFSAKAMAIYKQIRGLITQHLPDSKGHYGPVVDKLAKLYVEAGLTGDALATYEEYSAHLQKVGRDDEVLGVLRKIVEIRKDDIDSLLNLAKALQREQQHEEADRVFRECGESLVQQGRRDEGLRYLDDVLQRNPDTALARQVADLYLDRNQTGDGLKALTRMKACFQTTQRDIETLRVLARAFQAVGQSDKGLEVRKLMVKIAFDKGDVDIAQALVDELLEEAPNDASVRALAARVNPDFDPKPAMPAPRAAPFAAPAPPPVPAPSLPSYDLDHAAAPDAIGNAFDLSDDAIELPDDELELSDDALELIEDSIVGLADPDHDPGQVEQGDDTQTNLPHLGGDYDQLLPDIDDFGYDDLGGSAEEDTLAPPPGGRGAMPVDSELETDDPFRISGLEDWSDEPSPSVTTPSPPPVAVGAQRGVPRPAGGVPRPASPAARAPLPLPRSPAFPAPAPASGGKGLLGAAPSPRDPRQGPIALDPIRPVHNQRPTSPASPRGLGSAAHLGGVTPPKRPPLAPLQAPPRKPIAPPPQPEVVVDEALQQVFEEVDFFLAQELYDDALSLLTEQIPRYPGHPLLIDRLQAVRAAKES